LQTPLVTVTSVSLGINQRLATMSAANEQITLSTQGKVAIITLNVPKKLNALTQDLYYRLACLLREIALRDDIYITVLTGTGRYFSA